MGELIVKTMKPSKMSQIQSEHFVRLHQQFLNLEKDFIINYLAPRDYVVLFYDKKSDELVATIGISIINLKKDVLIYFGNTVVDPAYKYANCISRTCFRFILNTILKHPFKNTYCCALASSSGAFEYALRHKPCWPNDKENTPEYITNLMVSTVEAMGVRKYHLEDGNVIVCELCGNLEGAFHKAQATEATVAKVQKNINFFNKLNKHHERGEQVFFLNLCRFANVLEMAVRGLRDRLIKCPTLYHKICRYKTTKPVYSSFLVMVALIKPKLWS